jgi:hypothetical protein
MANVSPYLKQLSTTTSSKLISLFNSMISPSFLLAKESNPALLHILLETLTNIIEHQHSQNPVLLYAIIRNHPKFQALQHFDLAKAMADLEERKKTKEDNEIPRRPSETPAIPKPSIDVATPSTPSAAFTLGDEEDDDNEDQETKPLSEKARGKLPEGVEIPRRESSFRVRSSTGLLSPVTERKDFHPSESWVPFSFYPN